MVGDYGMQRVCHWLRQCGWRRESSGESHWRSSGTRALEAAGKCDSIRPVPWRRGECTLTRRASEGGPQLAPPRLRFGLVIRPPSGGHYGKPRIWGHQVSARIWPEICRERNPDPDGHSHNSPCAGRLRPRSSRANETISTGAKAGGLAGGSCRMPRRTSRASAALPRALQQIYPTAVTAKISKKVTLPKKQTNEKPNSRLATLSGLRQTE